MSGADPASAGAGAGARVCLVTTEILGLTRTGGIATVTAALADLLVEMGHAVTVLCLNGARSMDGPFDRWAARYRRRGIALVPMPETGADPACTPMAGPWAEGTLARRWHVLHWLERQGFDLVHFTDWGGEAALCGRARAQGIALARTRLVMGLHGASHWTLTGNDTPLDGLPRLVQIELERMAPALMDAVWSPGRFMPDWLAAHGAPVTGVRIMPQLMPDPGPPVPPEAGAAPIREPVLFGRLEDRKGVGVLLDALDRLAADPDAPRPAAVTFLGRAATVRGEPAARRIARHAAAWPWPVHVRDTLDRDAALDILRAPGRLALILAPAENCPLTLLECLALGVPVLASATGGIPDLIADEDRARVLVPYDAGALAARLAAVLGRPFPAARPACDARAARAAWRDWHRALLSGPAERTGGAVGPPPADPIPLAVPDDPRACAAWAAALRTHRGGPVCLLTARDRPVPGALDRLGGVLARTGADLLAPAWREDPDGRVRPCLDSVPASAQAAPLVAGPGLVLAPTAVAVAAADWDPDSGLWGLVAVCLRAGLRHEAVPAVVLTRDRPWREPAAATARAPGLWAAVAPRDTAPLTAALLAGLLRSDTASGPAASSDDPWRRAARRDRRRARALWRSWPWRVTRPLRNRRRRRAGLAPEPVEPPPLAAPGAASDVMWGVLRSRSWALTAWLRALRRPGTRRPPRIRN
jgi:glycosyltransferase involved in cell wall biosynthesis